MILLILVCPLALVIFPNTSIAAQHKLTASFTNYQRYEDELKEIMKFFFQFQRCVQVSSDQSDLASHILFQLYTTSANTTYYNGVNVNLKNCNGYILITRKIKFSMSLLEDVHLYYDNRVLVLIGEGVHEHLNTMVNNASKWFLDSEVLMVIFGRPTLYFIRKQPSDTLTEISNTSGHWEREHFGVSDFNGKPIALGTFNCPIFSSFGALDEHGFPTDVGGQELSIIEEIFKKLNAKMKIVEPTTSDPWGQFDGYKWNGGIMGLVGSGQVDVAFCGLWIVDNMVRCKMETSYPTAAGCLEIIVPKPHYLDAGWFGLFSPFKKDLWLLVGASLILASVILYSTSRLTSSTTGSLPFVSSILLAASLFIAAENGKNHKRRIVIWWILLGFILTTSYSSGLITQITAPPLSDKMDTIRKLVENDFIWTSRYPLDVELMFDLNDTWESAWAQRLRVIPDQEEDWRTVATEKVVLTGQKFAPNAFMLDFYYPNELLRRFEITKRCISKFNAGFVLRPGSPYYKPIQKYLHRFHSAGLLEKYLTVEFEKMAAHHSYVREVFEVEKRTVKPYTALGINNLYGVFIVWAAGLTVSTATFLAEWLSGQINRNKAS